MSKRRAPTSFSTGRREGVKTGASKKKFMKWQAIRKGTMGQAKVPVGKKLNSKQKKQNLQLPLEDSLSSLKLPNHVAVIMDGNLRWAKSRKLPHIQGYREGVISLRELVRCCCEWNISAVTVFAFSFDNWKRPVSEVEALFALMEQVLKQELPALQEGGVRLHFFGDLERLPTSLQVAMRRAVTATSANDRLVLSLALGYSARQDILRATKRVAALVASGEMKSADITSDTINQHLSTHTLIPEVGDPDLLIRTSGEQRLSDFLLWEVP
ncbi:hypothetical protein CYMTET_55385 [Cymbomonas tetramitiformis]|uniref:Alkyl transferase n=1 Tax=Cymbomonas tetramitiformis TaxID=36881 RepID=A0AAE0BEW9_9CHLO|nr:hypothetical protein CYMTET_55385 [Cymbomonas tetramitiformis]